MTYSYDVRAEAVRDGKTSRTKKVIVKAGLEFQADFGDLANTDGSGPRHHLGACGCGASRWTASKSRERPHFQHAGTGSRPDHYYTVKTEAARNGRKVSDSRRVVVEAGPNVSVEFKETGVVTAGK